MDCLKKSFPYLFVLVSSGTAVAAPTSPPNSGLIYQQQQNRENNTPPSSTLPLNLKGQPLGKAKQGGTEVALKKVNFTGNTIYSDAQLQQVIGSVKGKSFDLAGLKELANQVSRYYREHDYSFATAFLPAQNLSSGELNIQVVEGQYGQVTVSGDDASLNDAIKLYLKPLKSGDVIKSSLLERQLLLIKDLPGVNELPVLKPGTQTGRGDLDVTVTPQQRVHAQFGINNYGSRYSGEYRLSADLSANHLFKVGDQLSLSGSYSNEDTWLGGINYSLPISYNGLRANIGYSHTDYQLGHGFNGYTGTADIYTVGASYPVIRSENANLSLSASYQYKHLDDDILSAYDRTAHSQSVPIAVNFDHRDTLLGGGVTWGQLTLTPGKIKVDETGASSKNNGFTKWNLELARLQSIGAGFNLYAHVRGQWADHETIDGSESFYLGGPDGVRAYPVGEGSDARGVLGQVEVRYQNLPYGLSPYLFIDSGYTPNGGIDTGDSRRLTGAGLGLRANYHGVNLTTAVAWKVDGGDALSDSQQRNPRVWFSTSYQF